MTFEISYDVPFETSNIMPKKYRIAVANLIFFYIFATYSPDFF